ncbi:MAG: chemotaxis protein CheX [Oceanicoccus sp.]|jgi:chemotaxis protein CheX
MNVEFINPFIEAMAEVLLTMAQTECKPGKATVKKDTVSYGDVSGIIGMSGEKMKGSFAISFSKEVILAVTERMLGEKLTSIDSTVVDLVGELTNIATGGAKKRLAENDYDFDLATPVVVSGEKHEIVHVSKAPTIIIPFTTDVGGFFIEVSFS